MVRGRVESGAPDKGWKGYHSIWLLLFLSWTVLYIDRSITGPVVAWMIDNNVGFMADAELPFALGGMVGSMFFAGYMLTQFPSGYLGDRFGHRAMIVLSLVWSGVATMASGLTRGLTSFIALRVLTGLGEGAYYSNDRAVVCETTPESERSLGLGLVFTGLALGMTLAFVFTPLLLAVGEEWLGQDTAWTLPFLIFSIPTLLLGVVLWRRFEVPKEELWRAGLKLALWSSCFLAALMVVYLATLYLGFGQLFQTVAVLLGAVVLIAIIYWRLGASSLALRDRRLIILYLSAIPLLYTLWFFGFWALMVVSESSDLGLSGAAVYAALFGLANGVGYPLGGRLGDLVGNHGRPRLYVVLCTGVAISVFSIALLVGSGATAIQLGVALFIMGVLFASAQTVHMTVAGDLSPPGQRGQTFGMWNLVAEIGAVLAPVLSGVLRDITGDWTLAILLDAVLLAVSAIMVSSIWLGRTTKRHALHRQ
ncbi:MAG: MFS transporter [Methanomassiliicoccales archaeon]|nr:MFS transporter [Methanomassiliicoccales archaeon]